MVPPPDTTGDEFPDFENMTPEEQMAWLESLAKRQGANQDEFTTAADLDIPVPENAVIDEPGYVPYTDSMRSSSAKSKPEPEPEPVVPEEEPPVDDTVPAFPETLAEDPDDPMQWLGSLAAQPGEGLEDLALVSDEDTSDLLEDLGTLDESFAEKAEATPQPEIGLPFEGEAEATAAAAALPTDDADLDALMGADPMAWLESLAKRQGANQNEFLTSADLEVEEVSGDVIIDEPGYVPFDVTDGARAKQTQPEPEEIVDIPEVLADADQEEFLEGADSMAWLESLAKRQGVQSEELTTAADLEIPEVPAGTVIDEPGYVEYSPFGELDDEIEEPEFEEISEELPVTEAVPESEGVDDSLSWLADLASEADTDVSELLSFDATEDEFIFEEAAPAEPVPDDPLAGMTDEEIARAQVQGQLTGEQELAWLKRQASKLAETRETEEVVADTVDMNEVAPAVPADLPDWLQEMRQGAESPDMELMMDEPALPAEEELSDWLTDVAVDADVELPDEVTIDSDVDTLWADVAEETVAPEAEVSGESELEAFLESGLVPEEPDQLAEALDDEFNRKLVGDDSEPDWYTEAVSQIEPEEMPEPDMLLAEEGEVEQETLLAEAEPVDMPDWLKLTEDEVEPAVEGDMPSWLTESIEAPAVPEIDEMPDWLTEVSDTTEVEALDWLPDEAAALETESILPAEPEMVPEELAAVPEKPTPEQEPPPPAPAPVTVAESEPGLVAAPSIPESELFEQYRVRLEQDPEDYPTRLALARALRTHQEMNFSLEHYEMLVDHSQLLQDVQNDLASLTQEHANIPRLRRLLGDVYMRQGKLQEALDAYRNALDQL